MDLQQEKVQGYAQFKMYISILQAHPNPNWLKRPL